MSPRLAAWLAGLFIPAHRREELLGDLEELFAERARTAGSRAARRWYWRQAVAAAVDAVAERRRRPSTIQGDSPMQTIGQDLRLAVRGLVAQPGFALVAVLMLALGIGANVTIFSWINSVLFHPLPGADRPQELVQLSYLYRGTPLTSFSYPDYRRIRDSARLLQGVTGYDDLSVGVAIDREAERAWAEIVPANFFDVLGVPPVAGRGFTADDDLVGAPAVAVISHAFWNRRFAGDPSVVGRQIRVNAQPFTIVGVAPAGFQGAESVLQYDLFVPVGTQPIVASGGSRLEFRGNRWLSLVARLGPGVSREQARAEFEAIVADLRASGPGYEEHQAAIYPLSESPNGGVTVLRPVLLILMAVAAIVLLIACANLAGLLLARASARQREMAIRQSLGASRGRIVQQLLVEGCLLAGLGTAGALIALQWTAGLLIGFTPPSELPIFLDVKIDRLVLGFAAAVAAGTVLLFALAPAAQAVTADLAARLREAGMAGRAFGRHRLRRALVAVQVALSITLLVGAGLCLRSLDAAARTTPGFNPHGIVVGWLDLFAAGYSAEQGRAFYSRLLDRMRALPGVEGVTLSRRIPLGFMGGSFSDVTVDGHTFQEGDPRAVGLNYVGPDYATTLRMPLVTGRDLTVDDVAGQPSVALISEAMAQRFWKGRDPIGGRFAFGRIGGAAEPRWITVVGVARDIKHRSLTEAPQPYVFLPILQAYAPASVLHVRTAADPGAIGPSMQRVMSELDARVPFYNVSVLADHLAAATFQQRLAADLLVVFGALALLLAGVGSYGVLSYLVGQRRREIGIRLAVGATRADVVRLVCASGARLIGTGLAVGLLLSAGVGMGLRSLLIGVSPADPVTYAGVLIVLTAVAAAACLLPARRAAAVDPATTLREE